MPAVTISRQMGSLGFDIARITAQRLGFKLVWREVINQAARRAGTPEVALAAIDELGLLGLCPGHRSCQAYRQAVEQVINELANEGNYVIIGRGGQVILKDRPDVIHARIIAPLEVRAQRIAQKQSITLDCARAQVEASDRFRFNYLKRYYQARVDNPELYDLVLNTERFSAEAAAAIICQMLEARLKNASRNQPILQEKRFESKQSPSSEIC